MTTIPITPRTYTHRGVDLERDSSVPHRSWGAWRTISPMKYPNGSRIIVRAGTKRELIAQIDAVLFPPLNP